MHEPTKSYVRLIKVTQRPLVETRGATHVRHLSPPPEYFDWFFQQEEMRWLIARVFYMPFFL